MTGGAFYVWLPTVDVFRTRWATGRPLKEITDKEL